VPEELHVASLILARGGSKGIRRKNLAKINGTTLLKRSLMAIHEFGSKCTIFALLSTFCVEIFLQYVYTKMIFYRIFFCLGVN
jgi:CMP-2-keto-3-deoxyoctulosonic acid synthetase